MLNRQNAIDNLVTWIKQTTPKGAKVLIPVSGGSDSALCFWLCNQALPGQVKGVYIGSDLREKEWFEAIGKVHYVTRQLPGQNPEVARWAYFLTLSIQENRILGGSRNRTEEMLGTFSHASKVCSFLPLAHLWKTQVMELCAFIGVPQSILLSSQQADPACGRPKRMATIPFVAVDAFLKAKLQQNKAQSACTKSQLQYLQRVYTANSYKKELPRRPVSLYRAAPTAT